MKNAVLLAMILGLAPVAGADDDHKHRRHDGPEFTLSFGAGGFFGDTLDEGDSPLFDQGVDIDESLLLEARFGVRPARWFEVEASVSFAPSELVVEGDAGLFGGTGSVTLADVDVWHYTVNGNFHFLRDDFDPFFTMGLGAATYDLQGRGVDADTKFALVIGGGFTWWVGDLVGLRADVRDYVTVLDVDSDYDYSCECYYDYDSESDTLHNVGVTAGLALRWN